LPEEEKTIVHVRNWSLRASSRTKGTAREITPTNTFDAVTQNREHSA
jgi:hypothetical protein